MRPRQQGGNSRRSYSTDLADFQTWCGIHGLPALSASPTTISALAQAGRKVATIEHGWPPSPRPTSWPDTHPLSPHSPRSGSPWPASAAAWVSPRRARAPLVTAELRRLVRLSGPTPLAEARDRALFLVGFAAGLRRSELVALDVRDLEESGHGLIVHLRRRKIDQEGAGEQRGIPNARRRISGLKTNAMVR